MTLVCGMRDQHNPRPFLNPSFLSRARKGGGHEIHTLLSARVKKSQSGSLSPRAPEAANSVSLCDLGPLNCQNLWFSLLQAGPHRASRGFFCLQGTEAIQTGPDTRSC